MPAAKIDKVKLSQMLELVKLNVKLLKFLVLPRVLSAKRKGNYCLCEMELRKPQKIKDGWKRRNRNAMVI